MIDTFPYAALQVTTNFSFLRGASHPDELVKTAKRLGLAAIAITDRNTLAGIVRMHVAAKKLDMRLIIGVRLILNDAPDLLCYPKDRPAYGRLSRLLSLGQRRTKKGLCDLALADVAAHQKGQLFIVPPPSQSELSSFGAQLGRLKEQLTAPLYLGLAHNYCGNEQARFNALRQLGTLYKLPLIAASNVLYHQPARKPLADILTCIREKCTIDEAGLRLSPNAEAHFKPSCEMQRLYKGYEDTLARTMEIADHCHFSLDELAYDYPREPVPKGATTQQHLEKLSYEGANWRYPQGLPNKVRASLLHELKLIDELNYAPYFLTVHDIVNFARSKDILCQGRGSAANSAVCYCLGITNVDPTKIDLLFERFISAERDEPPDIDVDFEHERREEVIQYIYQRFGREHAGLAATLITYRPRSAVRDVGKAMGLCEDIVSRLAGTVWGHGHSKKGSKDISDKRVREAGLNADDPRLIRTLQLTTEIMGFPRHLSQHVGGFVLTHSPLCEMVPIGNAAMKDRTVIEWDKTDLAALGLLKIDILALGMLSCVHRSFDLIEQHYDRSLTLASVPREDSDTYDMLCKADTVGVFQIESRAQMNMLPRLKPRIFYDLVIEVAIVRPGPIQGDMVHPYLRRRDGLEEEIYPAPDPRFGPPNELRTILGKTKGVPLFQEQAMRLAMVAADFSPAEANALRKSMATFRHRGTIELLQDKMVERMVTRGYERNFAERCFNQIKGFGDYGFPESHAASFAHLVYISSWIKCHYPDVFACALLNSQPMGFYAPAQIVRDAREHGIKVLPVDVSTSDWDCTLEANGDETWALRLGMRQISGLRRDEAEKIVEARSFTHPHTFHDMEELRTRSHVRCETLEKLAGADAFRSMGLERRTALWHIRGLADATPLPLFAHASASELSLEPKVELPRLPLSAHVLEDYRNTRLSLKAHPLSFLRNRLQAQKALTCLDLMSLHDGAFVKLSGVVLIRQRPGSAKGVVFMTIEDETGIANLMIWSKVMEKFRKTIMTARLIEVQGRLQRHKDILHVVADRLYDQTDWLSLLEEQAQQDLVSRTSHPHEVPAARRSHPRNVRIIPKSRDFH
ncbi:MAG: error-prone DNA polymerase [bacterium]|nr:error-prone DNA polymerase [bacterium]